MFYVYSTVYMCKLYILDLAIYGTPEYIYFDLFYEGTDVARYVLNLRSRPAPKNKTIFYDFT